jgi:hypothetical protein
MECAMAFRGRSVVAILVVCLMPQFAACTITSTRRVPLGQLAPEELGAPPDVSQRRFVGVTVAGGAQFTFDSAAPISVTPTLVSVLVKGTTYLIPRRTITRVWVAGPVGRARAVPTSSVDSALTAPWPATRSPVGVTLRSGDVVPFDGGSAAFTRDTVYATVRRVPVRIAVSEVQRVAVVRENHGPLVGALGGALVGVVLPPRNCGLIVSCQTARVGDTLFGALVGAAIGLCSALVF